MAQALVGSKKSEKSQSSEHDENARTVTNKFWNRRKHSVDIDADKLQHEFTSNFTPFVESNALSEPEAASIPSDPFKLMMHYIVNRLIQRNRLLYTSKQCFEDFWLEELSELAKDWLDFKLLSGVMLSENKLL